MSTTFIYIFLFLVSSMKLYQLSQPPQHWAVTAGVLTGVHWSPDTLWSCDHDPHLADSDFKKASPLCFRVWDQILC